MRTRGAILSSGARYCERVIDCDIHPQIGDPEELLAYVDPAQRSGSARRGPRWGFPATPGPTRLLVSTGHRAERATPGVGRRDGGRELLDPSGTDVGVLNGDDAVLVPLMPSPYRAAELARAHNEWLRERWLDAEPRLRASILCPAQDPQAAAAEIRRAAEDERFVQVLLCGGADRPYGEPRYLPDLRSRRRVRLPVAVHSGGEGMGIAAPPGAPAP